jgi:hypothetical protein
MCRQETDILISDLPNEQQAKLILLSLRVTNFFRIVL